MHPALGAVVLVVGLLFGHWKFVDMWLAGRGGLNWFWRNPNASGPLKLARLTFLLALIVGASAILLGTCGLGILTCLLLFANIGLMLYVFEHPR